MKRLLGRVILLSLALCLMLNCLYPWVGSAETTAVRIIRLSADKAVMTVGESRTFEELTGVFYFPAVENPPLFWRVGDSNILSVSDGKIKALHPGVTYVELMVMDEVQASARMAITVVEGPAETPAPAAQEIFEIPQEGHYTFTTFIAAADGTYELRGTGDETITAQAYLVRLNKQIQFKQKSKGELIANVELRKGDEVYIQLTCAAAKKAPQELQLTITWLKPLAKATRKPAPTATPYVCETNPPLYRPTEAPSENDSSPPTFEIDIQGAINEAYKEALEMAGGKSTEE